MGLLEVPVFLDHDSVSVEIGGDEADLDLTGGSAM